MRGQPIWTTDTHGRPRHSFKRRKKAGTVGRLVDAANPQLDRLGHGDAAFMVSKERRNHWGTHCCSAWPVAATAPRQSWQPGLAKQDVARFLVWLRQKRGNSSAMRINNSKAGLTSQELEHG